MKNFKIHTLVVNIVVLLSLFLSYQRHKIFDSSGDNWFDSSTIKSIDPIAGIELPETYFFLGGVLLITFATIIWRNLATAIIGSVLSIGLGLYIPLLAFILTFNIFQEGDDLGIGYYIGSIAIFYFIVIQFINMVQTARNKKSKPKNVDSDILDDF